MSPEDNFKDGLSKGDCPPDPIVEQYQEQQETIADQADGIRKNTTKAKVRRFLTRNQPPKQ